MNTKTPSATIALGAVALLTIALLGWFVAISPASSRLGETQASAADVEAANAASRTRLQALQRAEEELPATTRAAAKLDAIFPPTADQAGFFADVNAAARDAGIPESSITNLSPSAPQGVGLEPNAEAPEPGAPLDADLAMQGVTLSVDATFEQSVRLLANLAALDRAVFVESVSLSGDPGGQMTLSVTADTFVAPPIEEPAGLHGDPVTAD